MDNSIWVSLIISVLTVGAAVYGTRVQYQKNQTERDKAEADREEKREEAQKKREQKLLDRWHAELARSDARIKQADARMKRANERIDLLETALSDRGKRIAALTEENVKLKARVQELERRIGDTGPLKDDE